MLGKRENLASGGGALDVPPPKRCSNPDKIGESDSAPPVRLEANVPIVDNTLVVSRVDVF
jgi:hypothetical protein